jgi:hypothetical protein
MHAAIVLVKITTGANNHRAAEFRALFMRESIHSLIRVTS